MYFQFSGWVIGSKPTACMSGIKYVNYGEQTDLSEAMRFKGVKEEKTNFVQH
jgi:hypothetical protein